jgi:translation initiation factor eIF-2B subunit delta
MLVFCDAETEDVAKAHLVGLMAEWLNEKVALADRVLVEHAVSKVYDGDVILTYAYSQVCVVAVSMCG